MFRKKCLQEISERLTKEIYMSISKIVKERIKQLYKISQ